MVAQRSHSVADDLGSDTSMRRTAMVRRDPTLSGPPERNNSQVRRAPSASGLYDVVDLILDKGIVIDAFVRVSLVGIELLTIDLRVVVASVDTYLRYAEGVERLQVNERSRAAKLPDVVGGGMKRHAVKQGVKKVASKITGGGSDDDEDDNDDDNEGVGSRLTDGVRNVLTKGVGRIVGRLAGDDRYEDDNDDDGNEEEGGEARGRGREARRGGGDNGEGERRPARRREKARR